MFTRFTNDPVLERAIARRNAAVAPWHVVPEWRRRALAAQAAHGNVASKDLTGSVKL